MSIYDEECRGCTTYESSCLLNPVVKSIPCPCLTCVVKSMCYRSCEEHREFTELNRKENLKNEEKDL